MTAVQLTTAIGSFCGIFILILDGRTALLAALEGINLCLKTVIPALFPFFICSSLLMSSTLGIRMPLLQPLGRLFSLTTGNEALLIPAFLGGYPVGAQCVANAWHKGQLSRQDAQYMLSFCSNAGPSFLFGIIGHMFPQKHIPWLLWIIHITSAWMVSRLYPTSNKPSDNIPVKTSLSQIMGMSVKTMGMVCGWIVLFRIIVAFLDRWFLWILPQDIQVLVIGLLELANGCNQLQTVTDPAARFLLCSVILSLGGICITLQTISVTQGLSLKYYYQGKGLQCLFSLLLSMAVLKKQWAFICILPLVIWYFSEKIKNTGSNPEKAVV